MGDNEQAYRRRITEADHGSGRSSEGASIQFGRGGVQANVFNCINYLLEDLKQIAPGAT